MVASKRRSVVALSHLRQGATVTANQRTDLAEVMTIKPGDTLKLIKEIEDLARRGAENELRMAQAIQEIEEMTSHCPRCADAVKAVVSEVVEARR